MTNTPPAATLRDGNLKATIWQNEGEKGAYFTTTFAKTYRDQQSGELRDTNVFTSNDLLKISELAREARTTTRKLYQDRSHARTEERTPEKTPERSPERTQEGTPHRTPERHAEDRKARAEAFDKDRQQTRSPERDYALEH